MNSCRRLFAITGMTLLAVVFGPTGADTARAAVRTWTGAGADANWSTVENWQDNLPPNPAGGDSAVFGTNGLGVSVVDQNWILTGLTYNHTNAPNALHIHDLTGNRLTLASGRLQAGHVSNTHIVISNGVFQVGAGATAAEIRLGRLSGGPATNALLSVYGTFETRNRGHVYVGYNNVNARATYHRNMTLDLSQCVIVSDGATNSLKLNDLYIGYQYDADGLLRLPPALTNLHVNTLGCPGLMNYLKGTIDLGETSQLRSMTCDRDFYFGRGGTGQFLGWPTNVNITVGASGTPGKLYVGYNGGWDRSDASLTVSNAIMRATLDELQVGYGFSSWSTGCGGFLDLEYAQIQIGDTPNRIQVDTFEIAGGAGAGADGELRLPAAIESIETKILSIGNAYTYVNDSARATLRLGASSKLTNLVATQAFRFGWGCKAFLYGFPANVHLRVGAPNAPATVFYMGSRDYCSPVVSWTPDRAHVSIHVDDFRLGSRRMSNQGTYRQTTGTFDLRQSTIDAFVVTNQAWIGASSPDLYNDSLGQGYLYLPECDAYFHKLAVGVGTHATRCEGVVDLRGGRFVIGASLRVGSRGRITSRVNGESGGPWLLSDDPEDFVVDENGLIAITFAADPLDTAQRHYWGLAAAGDQTVHFADLEAAGRLTWNTDGLDPNWARKVGIHYDRVADITYVGLDPRSHGTLFMIR